MKFTIGSLFDGSGGFPLAASMVGGVPVLASEIEPYPIAVTRSRFPQMQHLGDVSKINGAEIEPVDVIAFGSPCQGLSVAGLRYGLEDERSGLFMDAVRIIRQMREATHGRYPTYAVWENVPGAFSSNGGEDFRTVLEELIKIVEPRAVMPAVPKNGWAYADCYVGDGWSIAYRVFDAQYWGVPQRRRRIHLVLDLRGGRAADILFEREGVRGYFETGRTPWQGTASDAQRSVGADDRKELCCVAFHLLQDPIPNNRIYPCIGQGNSKAGQASVAVCIPINDKATRYKGGGPTRNGDGSGNGLGVGADGDPSPTLTAGDRHAVAYGWPLGFRTENVKCYEEKATTICNGTRPGFCNGIAVCYEARGNGDGVVVPTVTGDHENRVTDYTAVAVLASSAENAEVTDGTISPCLMARAGTGGNQLPLVAVEEAILWLGNQEAFSGDYSIIEEYGDPIRYIVRRLTPTECARLQGFPDRWGDIEPKTEFTDAEYAFWLDVRNTHAAINGKAVKEYTKDQMVKWYNKLHTDSAEYKMWGNGIALPPALYVMQGIADAFATEE